MQDVPDIVDRGYVALAAKLGLGKAEKSHDVAVVGVEELAGVLLSSLVFGPRSAFRLGL